MERVIVYIDGFNLYFGLRERGLRRFYWLDVRAMSEALLKPQQTLAHVHYFTSRVSPSPGDPGQDRRQSTYLDALATLPDTTLHFGHYLSKTVTCRHCGNQWQKPEEKMTDVNIAVEMLADAHQDLFDTALLVTGDSDLNAPVAKIRQIYPNKRVVSVFPPKRVSQRLKQTANAFFSLSDNTIRQSQLPNPVVGAIGINLPKPKEWQ